MSWQILEGDCRDLLREMPAASEQLGRDFIGCELNPEYARLARERILVEGRPGARNHEPVRVHEDQLGLLG